MLANGTRLFKKGKNESAFTEMTGLKEVPELGNSEEKVENTGLTDKVKQYEFGVGDPGDLEYKFKYENKSENSPYRVMRKAADAKEVISFEERLPDGTVFAYDAMVSVKLGGGAVNGVLEWTLKMALQSDITVTDPGETAPETPNNQTPQEPENPEGGDETTD